jgi:sRNA-binding carbon storage regulator CsrA
MLAVTLRNGERVRLRDRRTGEVTWVMVLRGNDGKARIGIDASADVDIVREELLARSGTTPGEGSSPA